MSSNIYLVHHIFCKVYLYFLWKLRSFFKIAFILPYLQKWRPGDLVAMGGSITYYTGKSTYLLEYWTSAESRSFYKSHLFILPFLQKWGTCWGYLGQGNIFAARGQTTQNPDKCSHLCDIIGHSLKICIDLEDLWFSRLIDPESTDWIGITSVYVYLYFGHVHGNNGAQEIFLLDLV